MDCYRERENTLAHSILGTRSEAWKKINSAIFGGEMENEKVDFQRHPDTLLARSPRLSEFH